MKKLISIIIPAYNEEECVEELSKRLIKIFNTEENYNFEVLVIENGSVDNTYEKLLKINQVDSRFKIIKLSRNFRMDGGLTAGLDFIQGDACIFMTADLQDPPELIPDFIRKWEAGFHNIYGKIESRKSSKMLRRINSRLFYFIAHKFAKDYIIKGVSDFRLLDKNAYLALRKMNESNRFLRAMSAWVGFKSFSIPLERPPRFGGKSNADTFKVLDLAIKGILAFSNLPLRIITFISIFLFIFSLIIIIFLLYMFFVIKTILISTFFFITLILFLINLISIMLSILAEYLGLIYEEVKMRPKYIVEKIIGL